LFALHAREMAERNDVHQFVALRHAAVMAPMFVAPLSPTKSKNRRPGFRS